MKTTVQTLTILLLSLSATSCNRNPNVEIAGAYFPGWMICLTAGLLLTLATHWVLRRFRIDHAIGHPAVIYPSILVFFTCLLWLCFFA